MNDFIKNNSSGTNQSSDSFILQKLFEEQVKNSPNSVCISCGQEKLTYEELDKKANKVANYLKRRSPASSKVGLCLERSIESIVVLVGILKSGKAYVPLDPTYPSEWIHLVMQDSRTGVLITQEKFLKLFEKIDTEVIVLESLAQEINAESSSLTLKSLQDPKSLAAILYTSGTTSKPKGVCLTHQGLSNRIVWMKKCFNIASQDRTLNKTSICFDISIWEIFLPLISGGRIICAKGNIPRSSEELISLIQREKVTIIHFVPQMLKYFLETNDVKKCTSLRHVFISGDVLHFHTQIKFFRELDCDLHNLYGPTETSIDVTHWHCQKNSELDFVPIGKSITNVHVYVLNGDFEKTRMGEIGEIFIGGICLAQGYINKSLTSKCFSTHPKYGLLYRTGDLAKLMSNGNISFVGRRDRQIKLGGYRVELSAIEEAIASYPEIYSVAVHYREEEPGFKQVVAYVVVSVEKIEDHIDQLITYLKGKVPHYMIPAMFAIVKQLPLTVNFKINYSELPSVSSLKKIKDYLYREF